LWVRTGWVRATTAAGIMPVIGDGGGKLRLQGREDVWLAAVSIPGLAP
jgi:hypothetical protein